MIPAWYRHNFHDIEAALMDFFTLVLPEVTVTTWIPDDWFGTPDQAPGDYPLLRIMRIPPGEVKWRERSESCSVQIAAAIPPDYENQLPNRDQAWEVINVVRACLLPMDGFPITYNTSFGDREVFIKGVEETTGPELLPELGVPDARVVPVMFRVDFDLADSEDYLATLRGL